MFGESLCEGAGFIVKKKIVVQMRSNVNSIRIKPNSQVSTSVISFVPLSHWTNLG